MYFYFKNKFFNRPEPVYFYIRLFSYLSVCVVFRYTESFLTIDLSFLLNKTVRHSLCIHRRKEIIFIFVENLLDEHLLFIIICKTGSIFK